MNTVRQINPAAFRRTALAGAAALLAAGLALPAFAQEAQKLERVEITGSSIKRLDAETALPVQIIRREDIDKSGATTAAELLAKVTASTANLTDGASFSDIAGQRGFSGANLRGIGVSSTLVLLNGRRVANFASPGGASGVDLNSIPLAAIERVEVLKDGASAIYGTDAISGVINFITRQDYQGVDIYAYYGDTQDGGADKKIITLSGGIGSLEKDGYNAFAVLDISKTGALRSGQRDWIGSVFQPDINLDVGSSNSFPANVRKVDEFGAFGRRYNPSAPNCNPPATIYEPDSFVGSTACLYNYMQDTEIFPKSDKLSLLSHGDFRINEDHTLFGEVLLTNTQTTYRISPLTISNLNYPSTGQYYPTGLIPGWTDDVRVNMRLTEAGGRTNEVDATTGRLVVGAKGLLAGWDYNTAINYSQSRVTDAYVNGYVKTDEFNAAFGTGVINPFGPSAQAGLDALNATKIHDDARKSKGTTIGFDVRGSRDLFAMDGGAAALALGYEFRREELEFRPSQLLQSGQIRGDGAADPFDGSRNVNAVFAELNLPVLKTLEAQLALRHDRYSDAGNTTNPKIGLRWTPVPEVIVRGSYGEGFRAPTLADLYTPERIGQTNGIYDDAYCAQVIATDDNYEPDYCGLQPDKRKSGSKDLKPEESKQWSAGIVFQPIPAVSGSVDYWKIEKTNTIVSPEGAIFADVVRNANLITRGPEVIAGIPGPILEIDSRLRNAGKLETSGIDVSFEYRGPALDIGRFSAFMNGTYVIDFKTQELDGAELVSGVGQFANDQVVQRWRHSLGASYDYGPASVTLIQNYLRGYTDQTPLQDGSTRRVDSYQLWDLTGSYAFNSAFKMRAGVKNLFDEKPPVSNQVYSFLAGYDPNYTDPRGRFFFISGQYSFR